MRGHFGRSRSRRCDRRWLRLCNFYLGGFNGRRLDRCSRLLRTLEVRAWCRGGIAHGGVVVLTGLAVLACFAIALAAVAAITVA